MPRDGEDVAAGDGPRHASRGPARALLSAERTALNLLGRLCGIATATRDMAGRWSPRTAPTSSAPARPPPACARSRSTPCAAAAAHNHRFGLDDAVLIKDNHLALAGGIRPAVERARRAVGHLVKIEVEVDSLDQLREALDLGADVVLLDNMSLEMLREAVAMAKGQAITEASGGSPPRPPRRSPRPAWISSRWAGSPTARRRWTWRWMLGRPSGTPDPPLPVEVVCPSESSPSVPLHEVEREGAISRR